MPEPSAYPVTWSALLWTIHFRDSIGSDCGGCEAKVLFLFCDSYAVRALNYPLSCHEFEINSAFVSIQCRCCQQEKKRPVENYN